EIELVWFQQPHIAEWLQVGVLLRAFGTVKRSGKKLQLQSPEYEVEAADDEDEIQVGRIVPVYPATRGVPQRALRTASHAVLELAEEVDGGPYDHFFPDGLAPPESYRAIHFPDDFEQLAKARDRFLFESLFSYASGLVFRRQQYRGVPASRFGVTEELDQKIRSVFPFVLSPEQDRVVAEIRRDLDGDVPMYRLLQGDVGTGKTAVSIYAILVAVRAGRQAALMAPTEILAEQHVRTLRRLLSKYPVRIDLLTGSSRAAGRQDTLDGLASGAVHVLVGTHALVQDSVQFARLGLVVIDEQHRFGVRERQRLFEKGDAPHLLVMTATPIPRSLCMTCYGDLDLSLIRERPGGQGVVTRTVAAGQQGRAFAAVREELARGRQAYFVYPLVEESEELALPAASEALERLRGVFTGQSVDWVHGRMNAEEKEERLGRFRAGEIQVLVATSVVEVGIDVPNATVLYLEDASRFGLAQLHQLRGRVGRGEHPGVCFVSTAGVSDEIKERLEVFAATPDGFGLAEEDLRRRGPGELLGRRQSGRPSRALFQPLAHLDRFAEVRKLADRFWAESENQPFRGLWSEHLPSDDADLSEFL
ncbi:MAG: ATP-dependent DNA helicase RecG, partial [Planctomycetota bacterium]